MTRLSGQAVGTKSVPALFSRRLGRFTTCLDSAQERQRAT